MGLLRKETKQWLLDNAPDNVLVEVFMIEWAFLARERKEAKKERKAILDSHGYIEGWE